MSECHDKKFERMLHHYELGMLSESEALEVEHHLYECDSCFEKLQRMEKATGLIGQDRDIRRLIERQASVKEESPATGGWRSLLRPSLSVPVMVAVIIGLILILKPWHIEFSPDKIAIAAENRIAIPEFENISGEADGDRLAKMASHLLIADLSSSEYLTVLSDQRLKNSLKLMGKENEKIDSSLALALAENADAKWLVTGKILQVKPKLEVTVQLIRVESGEVESSYRIEGSIDETIFDVVDKITAKIKLDLDLPEVAFNETDFTIADATTSSPEAYHCYLEGLRMMVEEKPDSIYIMLHRALEYDSTFAAVYYYLSYIEDTAMIEKAVEYSDKVSFKEQKYIMSRKAEIDGRVQDGVHELESLLERYPEELDALYDLASLKFDLAKFDTALVLFNRILEIDPAYDAAYMKLSEVYDYEGDYTRSIWAINRFLELNPDNANGYNRKAKLLESNGLIDQAIIAYQKAIELNPGMAMAAMNMGTLILFDHQFERADSIFRAAIKDIDNPRGLSSAGWMYLPFVNMIQGKFSEALMQIDSGIAVDLANPEEQRNEYALMGKYAFKRQVCMEIGRCGEAVEAADDFARLHKRLYPSRDYNYLQQLVRALARCGEDARVTAVMDTLKTALEEREGNSQLLTSIIGAVHLEMGEYREALPYLKESIIAHSDYFTAFRLSVTYINLGMYQDAISIIEDQLMNFSMSRQSDLIMAVKIHYYAGLTYDKLGMKRQAIAQYEEFLSFWGEADPMPDIVIEARTRLNELK